MDALSAMSQAADPYRAGLELGEQLAPVGPEAIFLATTIGYGSSTEIIEGLRDGLDSLDVAIVGNSGDGFYGRDGVGVHGASALALNAGSRIEWRVFSAQGIATDPEAVARRLLDQACAAGNPSLIYLACDFRTDATLIERVLADYPDVPIVGGLAADDDRLQESVLYADDQVLTDGVVALAAYGPLALWRRVANDMTPIGPWGTVEDADGTTVRSIDGQTARDFIQYALGKPILRSDRAIISLRVQNPDEPGNEWLRSVVPDFAGPKEHVGLFGGIRVGDRVQVCVPEADELLRGVHNLATGAQEAGVQPAAALMVSCAGRKWFLGRQVEQEVSSLARALGDDLPLAGFASYGEIGPRSAEQGASGNAFHNMTVVLTLLGS